MPFCFQTAERQTLTDTHTDTYMQTHEVTDTTVKPIPRLGCTVLGSVWRHFIGRHLIVLQLNGDSSPGGKSPGRHLTAAKITDTVSTATFGD